MNVANLNLPSCSRSVVFGQCTKLTEVLKEIRFYDVTRELLRNTPPNSLIIMDNSSYYS